MSLATRRKILDIFYSHAERTPGNNGNFTVSYGSLIDLINNLDAYMVPPIVPVKFVSASKPSILKDMRKGQTIYNFLRWLHQEKDCDTGSVHILADTFQLSDRDWDKYFSEFIDSLEEEDGSPEW